MTDAAPMHAIEIHDVRKHFGGCTAVDGLSLDIRRGELFALVGPDGAGKTTTIRMLCGILLPDEGSVRVLGFDTRSRAAEVKRRIGYLSQKFSLYGDLTVDENIEFFAEIHGVRDYRARREELLEFTRLTPFRTRLAERLSGGMKQKLALACVLIHTPELLLLDEPTSGVDPVSRRDFWKVLSGLLKSGITIIMTTPYLDEAERCHRVALMHQGKILVADEPGALKKLVRGDVVELACAEIRRSFDLLRTLEPVREVQAFGDRVSLLLENSRTDMPKVLAALKRNTIEVEGWRVVQPSLENVFISLLTGQASTESEVRTKT